MYQTLGWVLALIVHAFTVISVCFFYYSLVPAIHYTQSKSYREVTSKVLSNKLGLTLDIFNYINTFGIIAAYIIIGSNGVTQFLRTICKFEVKRTYIVKIILGVIEFPLTMLKRLTILGKIAQYSSIAIIVTAVSVWVYFFIGIKNKTLCSDIPYGITPFGREDVGRTVLNFFMYIPVFQTMYIMHNSLAPLYQELIGPKVVRVKILRIATYIVIFLSSAIYIITGYTGAITFNYAVYENDNIINTFSNYCSFVWPNILFIIYSFVVLIAYPLILFPIKQSLMELFSKQIGNKILLGSIIISLIYIVVSVGIACALESIVSVFGVFNSFTGIVIVFGVPLGMFTFIPKLKEQYGYIDQEEAKDVVTDPVLVATLSLLHPSMNSESINNVRRVSMALFNSDKDKTQDKQSNSVSLIYPRKISINVDQQTKQVNMRQSSISKQQYRSSISSRQLESIGDEGDDLIVQSNKQETQQDEQQQDEQQKLQPAQATIQTKLQEEQVEELDETDEQNDVQKKETVQNEQEYKPSEKVKKEIKHRAYFSIPAWIILTIISLESLYMNLMNVIDSYR